VLGGGLISLGILRSLGRRGIAVTLFDSTIDDIAYHSRYVRVARLGDCDDAAELIGRVIGMAERESQKPVLFVSGDRFLLHACRNAARLADHLQVLLPPLEAAETVVSKERFRAFAEAHSVPVPRSWLPGSEAELRELAPGLAYPVVLKPVRSMDWHDAGLVAEQGHIKMILADDAAVLLAHWTRLAAHGLLTLVQEYIDGGDSDHYSYVSYRNRDGRELAGATVRKLRLHPIHGGLSTCAEPVIEAELEATGRGVLEQLHYTSVASVCFKRDPATGRARIFEINGRLPLPHAALLARGIDLPLLMYLDAQGLPPGAALRPRAGKGRWIALSHDLWALREYRKCGEIGLARWLRSLLPVRHVVELDPRDPGPFLWFCRSLARLVLARLWKRQRG
jgi:predicted ATP-grasp superfamily ATP-dependent carboligase